MKKLLTLILVLCSVVGFAQMRGGAQYDPGAARSNLSNVDATAAPSMKSITLSDKIRAVWADILGDIYASGTVKVSTGTAAAPAYSFASDPNTGMYSPAADNLGVSVAGAEALRVNSAGEMLIATSTDAGGYKLQVNGNAYVNGNILSFGSNAQIVRNTADAFDNGYLQISGGGQATNSRGAYITLNGNESAAPGILNLSSGNAPGSVVLVSPTGGNVLVGTTTDAGDYKLQVNGNVYVTNDVSALSFTDRTPAPENLAESYAIVKSHEVKGKMLDHSKLHSAAWGTKTRVSTTGRTMKRKLDDGTEITESETEIISEPDPDGRNLSITITAQALVIKDLIKRIEALEKK